MRKEIMQLIDLGEWNLVSMKLGIQLRKDFVQLMDLGGWNLMSLYIGCTVKEGNFATGLFTHTHLT